MPLFRKPHGQLTWDDVKEFLEREVPENELLDYKGEMPQHIERTMAAMGNTYGGDIIIGVQERSDRDGRPVRPEAVVGVRDPKAARESIEQSNFSIHPPILGLDVQVVPVTAEDSCPEGDPVVVVRIPQSDLVPHFVPGYGHYGRAGSHGRPYQDVHLPTSQIEWLADRRARSADLRQSLLTWMNHLHNVVTWHQVWCVPQFPRPDRPLWEGTRGWIWGRCPSVRYRTEGQPFLQSGLGSLPSRSIQHGWLWRGEYDCQFAVDLRNGPGVRWLRPSLAYLVDDWGLVALSAIAPGECIPGEAMGDKSARLVGVRFDWTVITTHLMGVTKHAAALYAEVGYNGPVQFGLELGLADDVVRTDCVLGASQGPRPMKLAGWEHVFQWPEGQTELSCDPMTAQQRRLTETHECLAKDLPASVAEAARESRWTRAFNYKAPAEHAAQLLQQIEDAFVAPEDPA